MTLSNWLNLIGLLLGLAGAVYTVANPVMTEKAAVELAAARWVGETHEENLKLPLVRELLGQSRKARWGLSFIALGFAAQLAALLVDVRKG